MVFAVVNAQKQGVMGARLALATRTTMFQECAKLAFLGQGNYRGVAKRPVGASIARPYVSKLIKTEKSQPASLTK